MSIDLTQDLWQELKRFISSVDRTDAADSLVALLIDNDYDAEQIRAEFKNDSEIKRALQSYLDDDLEDNDDQDVDDDNDYEDY
jgi:hypothetical protein